MRVQEKSRPGACIRTLLRAAGLKTSNGVLSGLALCAFFFSTSPVTGHPLVITEIMYNPTSQEGGLDGDEYEFVELLNTGPASLNISGYTFSDGISYVASNFTYLATGQYAVIARNRSAFTSRYPSVSALLPGNYTGKLNNDGELIEVRNQVGVTVHSFNYGDGASWPAEADGLGSSLQLIPSSTNYGSGSSWCSSYAFWGTPGTAGSCLDKDILVNEVLTHTDEPQVDAVELYNASTGAVDLAGWYLSDENAVRNKFRVTNAVIAPGGYYVVYEDDFAASNIPGNISFSLSELGDSIFLTEGDAESNFVRHADSYAFDAAENGISFGRYPDGTGTFVTLASLSLGASNGLPSVGPLVISEIMYHPPDLDTIPPQDNTVDEFIEVHNLTAGNLDLFDPANPTNTWMLSGGITFTFPESVTLTNGEYALVIGTTNEAAFRTAYGLDPSVRILGAWMGKLDNAGESIQLLKPGQPETNLVPYIEVETISYEDQLPWPSPGADGNGFSLERSSLSSYGNDPENWHLGSMGGTPGVTNAQPANLSPAAYIEAPGIMLEGSIITLDGASSSDPEGTPLTFFWHQEAGPAGLLVSSTNESTLFKAPSISATTNISIVLNVTDSELAAGTATITIEVVNAELIQEGILSSGASWTAAESPVAVVSNLFIPKGQRISVEPGVEILLAEGASIITEGTFELLGSSGNPITVSCVDSNAYWGSLGWTAGATGVLQHAIVQHGSSSTVDRQIFPAAVSAFDGNLSVEHVTAQDMLNVCYYAYQCDVVFNSNTVRRTGEGINIVKCNGSIENSVFSFIRNGGDAIDVDLEPVLRPEEPVHVTANMIWASTGDGIDLGTASPRVDRNVVFHCADKGFSLGEGSHPDMANNLVWGCQIGIAIKDGSNPRVMHNTIVNNRVGISSYQKNPGMGGGLGLIANSILWYNAQNIRQDRYSLTAVRHSIVEGSPVWPGLGNTNIYPEFVSPLQLDFRLAPSSPLIDQAHPSYVPAEDVYGTPRPTGLGGDHGAIEYSAAARDLDRDGTEDDADRFAGDPRYAIDTDLDGLPDEWETYYFAGLSRTGDDDVDHDSQSNRQEYVQGSNPADSANEDVWISEVHYNPSGGANNEFIELFNNGTNTIDLTGWSFTDETVFHFPEGTLIAPGQHLVIGYSAPDLENALLGGLLTGNTEEPLGSRSANLRLTDDQHYPIDEMAYDVRPPWPTSPDGFGPSLERNNFIDDSNASENWNASLVHGGTPGTHNSCPEGFVVINEVLSNPAFPGQDWIELYNTSTQQADLAGYHLSDERDTLVKYTLPTGSVAAARDALLFDASQLGFQVDAGGEKLYLSSPGGFAVISQAEIPASQTNASWGRYPNGTGPWYAYESPSPGETNPAPVLSEDIVIHEIMYHAEEDLAYYDYIELFNRGTQSVDLVDWSFGDGFSFTFTSSVVLASGSYLVVAKTPNLVEAKYGITGVLGPFTSGKLANSGERVALYDEQLNLVDEVYYSDRLPWPTEPDGDGPSLELIHPSFDNDFVGAWGSSANGGTPGEANTAWATSAPPVVYTVQHIPFVPNTSEPVRVLVSAAGVGTTVSAATVYFRTDGAAGWSSASASFVPSSLQQYAADLGSWANPALIQYYVEIEDAAGQITRVPEGAPELLTADTSNLVTRTYLLLVDDTVYPTNLPLYRLLTTSVNWLELVTRDPYSNELLDGAFISGNTVMQNIGYRYRAQLRGDFSSAFNNLRIEFFNRDFHGDEEINLSNINQDNEYLASQAFKHVGIPSYLVRPVQLARNLVDAGFYIDFESPEEAFIERNYPGQSYSNALLKGWFEHVLGFPSTRPYYTLQTEAGAQYQDTVEADLDVEQWMEWFAATLLINNHDTLTRFDSPQNMMLYFNPDVMRWQILPADLDTTFPPSATETPIHQAGTADYVERLLTYPPFRKMLYEKIAGFADLQLSEEKTTPWITAFYDLAGTQYDSGESSFISGRIDYLEGYISTQVMDAFSPLVNTDILWTVTPDITFTGALPAPYYASVSMTGAALVSFSGGTSLHWSASVTGLTPGVQHLVVNAVPLSNRNYSASSTVSIHYLNADYDLDGISDQEEGILDSDGDGLFNFQDLDSDNDGFADQLEYLAQTDQTNAQAFTGIRAVGIVSNHPFIAWTGSTGIPHTLETRVSGEWVSIFSNKLGSLPLTNEYLDEASGSLTGRVELFRVRAE